MPSALSICRKAPNHPPGRSRQIKSGDESFRIRPRSSIQSLSYPEGPHTALRCRPLSNGGHRVCAQAGDPRIGAAAPLFDADLFMQALHALYTVRRKICCNLNIGPHTGTISHMYTFKISHTSTSFYLVSLSNCTGTFGSRTASGCLRIRSDSHDKSIDWSIRLCL